MIDKHFKYEEKVIDVILGLIRDNQEYLTQPENLPQLAKLGFMYDTLWYAGRRCWGSNGILRDGVKQQNLTDEQKENYGVEEGEEVNYWDHGTKTELSKWIISQHKAMKQSNKDYYSGSYGKGEGKEKLYAHDLFIWLKNHQNEQVNNA